LIGSAYHAGQGIVHIIGLSGYWLINQAWQCSIRAARLAPKIVLITVPHRAGRKTVQTVGRGARFLMEKTWTCFTGMGGLALEIASGALLGAMLGAGYAWKTTQQTEAILVGVLGGACVGMLVAASRRKAPAASGTTGAFHQGA
jgi:hypothetical protein